MKSDLSAFLDDELDVSDQHKVVAAMAVDSELRSAWDGYHLIRDALHRTPCLDHDLTARVMTDLGDEDIVCSAWAGRPRMLMRSVLAVAATVAGVSVVAWVAIAPSERPMVAFAKASRAKLAAGEPTTTTRMQEYLVAHQVYSPSNSIQGSTSYVRSVSATRATPKQ